MTTPPIDTTLLVLFLTLRKTEASLTQSEKNLLFAQLFEVGEQLELDPDDWDFIFQGLAHTITKYPVLNENFPIITTHINTLDSQTQAQLLPTEDELSQAFRLPIELEIRGDDHTKPDLNKSPLLQISVKILKSVNPGIAAKQSDWLNRIVKILPHLEL